MNINYNSSWTIDELHKIFDWSKTQKQQKKSIIYIVQFGYYYCPLPESFAPFDVYWIYFASKGARCYMLIERSLNIPFCLILFEIVLFEKWFNNNLRTFIIWWSTQNSYEPNNRMHLSKRNNFIPRSISDSGKIVVWEKC